MQLLSSWLLIMSLPLFLSGCATTADHKKISTITNAQTRKVSKWDTATRFQVTDYHLVLGVISNDTNLYIRLVTTDENLKNSIYSSGCTVWIDTISGKTRNFGIHYPANNKAKEPAPQETEGARHSRNQSRLTPTVNLDSLQLLLNAGNYKKTISTSEAQSIGIEVSIKATTGYLLWDLVVPLEKIREQSNTSSSNLSDTTEIGLEIDNIAVAQVEKSGKENSNGEGPPGQGGRSGRGGMRGGGMIGGGTQGNMDGESTGPNSDMVRQGNPPDSITSLKRWFTVNISNAKSS